MAAEATHEGKAIARSLAATFGGRPSVNVWWDEPETTSVAILRCDGAPQEGVSSFATVNLSDHAIAAGGGPGDLRVEIVGASATRTREFPNVISTCAFSVIKDGWAIAPGAIFPDVVAMYGISRTLRHVLFAPPTLWGDGPTTIRFEAKTVAFLMAVPISERERAYAEENGSDALEALFERAQIDVYDIDRPCVA